MNRFRNMEAVLILLFGGVCAGACVLDPPAPPRRASIVSVGPTVPVAVVVITGKRLTPAQKRAAVEAENARAG